MNITLFGCICILVLIQPSFQSFVVYSNSSLQSLFDEQCTDFKFLGSEMKGTTMNASYIAADPWDACSKLHDKQKYEGKIVIFGSSGCLPSIKAKHVQEAGGIVAGLFVPADIPGSSGLANARYDDGKGIDIPVVVIIPKDQKHFNWLKNSAQSSDNPNFAVITPDPREIHTGFWILFCVVMGVFCLINVALGSFRLYEIVSHAGKFQGTLPEICLVIEVAANLERIIMCIDPDYSTGWGLFPFSTNVVIQFLSIPWTLSATALIGAYWNHALQHFVQTKNESSNVFSAEKWKIPIAILCFFLVVWGTINAALQGYFINGSWRLWGGAIYIVVCMAVTIYFMVTGIRILIAVKKTSALTKSSQRMKKLAVLVGVSGFGIALVFVGMIAISVNYRLWKIFSFFGFVGLNTMSLAKVIIFEGTQQAQSSDTLNPTSTNTRSIQLAELQTA